MRIKIVYPTRLTDQGKPLKTKSRQGKIAPLAAWYLAGLTPPEHEVDVIDDLFEDINFDEKVDLAAVSAMTMQAPRAYQIAAEFRKRGVKTVMGGFHSSFLPEEAAQHVDAVVIGEAEPVWRKLLEDADRGKLEKLYKGIPLESLAGLPAPKYDQLRGKPYSYAIHPLWVGRGCPHNCVFCSVSNFYGRRVRTRPAEDILRDAGHIPGKYVFIIDDNLFSYGKMLHDLLPKLARHKFRFVAQSDISHADNEELLGLAREAGMDTVYLGLETFDRKSLNTLGKGWAKIEKYGEAVKKFHRHGIAVHASLMFGCEPETRETVRETLKKLEQWQADILSLYFYTPLPGSDLYQDLMKKGKTFSRDWTRYDGNHPLLIPEGSTEQEYEELYWSLYQGFYRPLSIAKRFFRMPYGPRAYGMQLFRNLFIFRIDTGRRSSVMENFFSFKELLPGYSSLR
jgi:radical SAM superfamily enzyme YgiQ (UPF0313 family)